MFMKSFKFCLTFLNIFIFSGVTLAEPGNNLNGQTPTHPSVINQIDIKPEITSDRQAASRITEKEIKSPSANSNSNSESESENIEDQEIEVNNTSDNSEEPEVDTESDESTSQDQPQPESEPAEEPEVDAESDESTSKDRQTDPEAKAKVDKPTPEEIARLKKLARADQLYLLGDQTAATKLYREAKEVWQIERKQAGDKQAESVTPFDDPEQLSPAGKVFWRNYQAGKKQQLESKVISALKLLTTREPEFIPGQLRLLARNSR